MCVTAPDPSLMPDHPICHGCGQRPQECWTTCDRKSGYCTNCDSRDGKPGACCMVDNGTHYSGDPWECQAVPVADFKHSGYHMCVMAPTATTTATTTTTTTPTTTTTTTTTTLTTTTTTTTTTKSS